MMHETSVCLVSPCGLTRRNEYSCSTAQHTYHEEDGDGDDLSRNDEVSQRIVGIFFRLVCG